MHAYRKVSDLASEIPVFPLSGAILFPRWNLPLNIFEPRYLNMVDDALSGDRLIGMVQSAGGDRSKPELMRVGCVGRLTSYSETDDGRYLITLSGLCRFTIEREVDAGTAYRRAVVNYEAFGYDLQNPDIADLPSRERLLEALKDYVERNQMNADWDTVDDAPVETLVSALSAGCPFSPPEKQALLEAPSLKDRCDTLIALLEMDMPGDLGGSVQ
ncbi:MAG: LON peptidase substrate-binding domain-containing protein [Pseudomonadota bacterium]